MSDLDAGHPIAPDLVEALRDAGDRWGPLGVALAAARLTDQAVVVRELTGGAQADEAVAHLQAQLDASNARLAELQHEIEATWGALAAAGHTHATRSLDDEVAAFSVGLRAQLDALVTVAYRTVADVATVGSEPYAADAAVRPLADHLAALDPDRTEATPGPVMHVIRRLDGEPVADGYQFMECAGPGDWAFPDERHGSDGFAVYQILACTPVAAREYGEPAPW